jgi:hypothetical protein
MEIIKKTIICDCCKLEKPTQKVKYPVLFLTEQTEGRSVKPYISYQDLDMCKDCMQVNITISGIGAMGYNEYRSINNLSKVWNDFSIKEDI